MKKTFTTIMPDKFGAFLKASRIFSSLNLNITRVSYNKAVDVHMLFLEVDGDELNIKLATEKLHELGYLQNNADIGNTILIEFILPDRVNSLLPVLELINKFNFNISYMSSHENDTDYQNFKIGLFVENNDDISIFIKQVTKICDIKIINYNPTGISLDNTVFYVSFSNKIAEQNKLSNKQKQDLILDSNLIMDYLANNNKPPYKTFDYIGKFANCLSKYHNENFLPRINNTFLNNGSVLTVIEPPVGSNISIIETDNYFVIVDSGFPSYSKETLKEIIEIYPNFDSKPKYQLITHADIDHIGMCDYFDKTLMSKTCYDNFLNEKSNKPNIREQNPIHAPYVRISKLLSHYTTPNISKFKIIGEKKNKESVLEKIGKISFDNLFFDVYEAKGGHALGEVIYVEKNLNLIFTGDIFVNIQGFTKEQKNFNRLAPYLMTSVDTAPELAKIERDEIFKLLKNGEWLFVGGHGEAKSINL